MEPTLIVEFCFVSYPLQIEKRKLEASVAVEAAEAAHNPAEKSCCYYCCYCWRTDFHPATAGASPYKC